MMVPCVVAGRDARARLRGYAALASLKRLRVSSYRCFRVSVFARRHGAIPVPSALVATTIRSGARAPRARVKMTTHVRSTSALQPTVNKQSRPRVAHNHAHHLSSPPPTPPTPQRSSSCRTPNTIPTLYYDAASRGRHRTRSRHAVDARRSCSSSCPSRINPCPSRGNRGVLRGRRG